MELKEIQAAIDGNMRVSEIVNVILFWTGTHHLNCHIYDAFLYGTEEQLVAALRKYNA